MNIRKIIKEEIKKIFLENYPMGAEYDSNAPWNQSDNTREGEKAKQIKYKLIWTDDSEFAFFKDTAGNIFVLYLYAIEESDLEPYADRGESYLGRDEDGMPDIEYGDWEIDGDIIENYVNDNLETINVGKGLDDYESGSYQLVMLDDELRNELLTIAPHIKDEKKRATFLSILGSQISEGGFADKIVNKKTMDTPIGTIFTIDFGVDE